MQSNAIFWSQLLIRWKCNRFIHSMPLSSRSLNYYYSFRTHHCAQESLTILWEENSKVKQENEMMNQGYLIFKNDNFFEICILFRRREGGWEVSPMIYDFINFENWKKKIRRFKDQVHFDTPKNNFHKPRLRLHQTPQSTIAIHSPAMQQYTSKFALKSTYTNEK